MSKAICLSGGAIGSDTIWGECAALVGHSVIHFSFDDHRHPSSSFDHKISQYELDLADPYLIRANKTLKRKFPTKSSNTNNLLRRNYYQIEKTDRVYAIASFDKGLVAGGTGWAVQMFIDRHNGEACEAYVFDQNRQFWFKWNGRWDKIDNPPVPDGTYTGIGTRDINTSGKRAIFDVFKKPQNENTVKTKEEETKNV